MMRIIQIGIACDVRIAKVDEPRRPPVKSEGIGAIAVEITAERVVAEVAEKVRGFGGTEASIVSTKFVYDVEPAFSRPIQ